MKKPSQSQPRHFARLTLGDYGARGADPPFEPQWPRSCYDGGAVVISLLRRLTGRAVVMSHRGMVRMSCVCSAAVSTVNRQRPTASRPTASDIRVLIQCRIPNTEYRIPNTLQRSTTRIPSTA